MRLRTKFFAFIVSLILPIVAAFTFNSKVVRANAEDVAENQYVAEIVSGSTVTPYSDLQTAFLSATSRATVRLLKDVELTETLTKGASMNTLDFNGFKIICPSTMVTSSEKFAAINAGSGDIMAKFVLKDSSQSGRGGIYCEEGSEAYCIHVHKNTVTIQIESGNYYGIGTAINLQAGEVNIIGGKFAVGIDEIKTQEDGHVLNRIDGISSRYVFRVSGGSFYNYDPANNVADGEGTNYVSPGYRTIKGEDNWYSLKKIPLQIGSNYYDTLEEAVNNVGQNQTIKLLDNLTGNGVVVPSGKEFTLDLGGFNYLVDGSLVGSPTTVTNGFQLLENSNITIKNGSITGGDKVRILIQNYSNLTLDNVHLIGGPISNYVLSNNFGNTVLKNNTKITAIGSNCAFDVYYGMSSIYDAGVTVTIEDSSVVIEGHVKYAHASRVNNEFATDNYGINLPSGYTLELANGLEIVSGDDGDKVVNSAIYQAQQFAIDWRAMRVSGGVDGICGLIYGDEMRQMLSRYNAMNTESKSFLDMANDGNCSIGDSIRYVESLLENEQANKINELFASNVTSSSVLIVALVGMSIITIFVFYYLERKRHSK